MSKQELYEKYADYYLKKFKDDKRLIIAKNWRGNEILHVEIYTKLPSFSFFMGIFPYMIDFDGICVCNHGIEFENIETEDPQKIYSCLDEEAKLILKYIKEGVFLFAYKDDKIVMSLSLEQLNRHEFLKNLDIRKLYNENIKCGNYTNFDDITKLQLLDFYGDVIYEYNQEKIPDKSS